MGDSSGGDEAIASPINSRRRFRMRVPADERDLVRAAQRGSADALEELARISWPSAYRIAIVIVRDRAAAEDIAQESVLAAFDALPRFNARKPFAPWLHRIATNRSLDWARTRSRRVAIEAGLDLPSLPASPDGLSPEISQALLVASAPRP